MYNLIIIPIVTVIIAQIIKCAIDAAQKKFSWKDLNSYGGTPSAHTAFCVALLVSVGYFQEITSSAFAITLIFSILIIRDAIGFRSEIGKHAQMLNQIIKQLPADFAYKYQHQKERIGHSFFEILAGIALGIVIPTIYILLLG